MFGLNTYIRVEIIRINRFIGVKSNNWISYIPTNNASYTYLFVCVYISNSLKNLNFYIEYLIRHCYIAMLSVMYIFLIQDDINYDGCLYML